MNAPILFELGRVVATPGALRLLAEAGLHPDELLVRHAAGDPGDVEDEERPAHFEAIRSGRHVVSSYRVSRDAQAFGWRVWLVTAADRSHTTLCLAEEM